MTDTAVRGFVLRLVGGILALVGLSLGSTFTIIGLAGDDAFLPVGLGALAAGVVCGLGSVAVGRRARRRAESEEAARTASGDAEVVRAHLQLMSRAGSTSPLRLTVRIAGTEVSRTVYVPPTTDIAAGDVVPVRYAPDEPANFVPLIGRASPSR